MHKEYDITIDWRGFELHPEIPAGGMEAGEYFPPDRLKLMNEYMVSFALTFGVDISFTSHLPSTRRALAMAEFAREHGALDKFRELAMLAYWRDGEDLEDEDVLRTIAGNSGLGAEAALAASTDKQYLARIDTVRAESESIGVTGIPTMIIGTQRIVGCQPYAEIATACERAGARKR